MTIDEAIKHCEEVAEKYCEKVEEGLTADDFCDSCASEHRQLAQWLKVLKEIWDSGDCNDCRNGQCEWKPKLGQLVRFNCPHYVRVTEGSDSDAK